jgi:hypothetical protein
MALIGNIAISMTTNSAGFVKGLKLAQGALADFEKGAFVNINSGSKLVQKGFGDILTGAKVLGPALGRIMSDDAKQFYGSFFKGGGGLLQAGFKKLLARDPFQFYGELFGDASKAIGRQLTKLGTVAKAVFPSFQFAPVVKGFTQMAKGAFQVGMGVTQLGVGFAKLGLVGVARSVQMVGRSFSSAGAFLGSFVRNIALVGVTAGVAAIAGMYKLVHIAGQMEQQVHRADIVFGAFSGIVIGESKKMADAFGIPKEEFIRGATALGALFKAEGYGQEQAAKLATGFTKLALDASRLTGIPIEEVMQKITKGAAGATKGLKDLGIYITDDVVKEEALKLGLVKLGQELSETAKIQARLSIIQKGLADATGQTGEQANSVMSRWDAFTGRITNLVETIANLLLPIIGPGGEMQAALFGVQSYLDGVGESMVASTTKVVGGAEIQAQSMGVLQKSVRFLADAWQVLKVGFLNVQVAVTFGIKKMVEGLGWLSASFDKLLEAVGKNKTGATEFLNSFAEELQNTINTQVADLDKAMKEPWSHDAVDSFFANAKNKLAQLQTAAGKGGLDLKAIGAPQAITRETKPEMKFSHAMEINSQDAANTILRSQYGGGRSAKELEKIAAKTGESAGYLKKLADNIGKSSTPGHEIWSDFK